MSEPWLFARWRGWARGDFGQADPSNAPPSSFSGKNVVVTQSGGIMQRGGLFPLKPQGTHPFPIWHIGILRGFGAYADDHIWFLQEQSGTHSVVRRLKFRDSSTGFVTGHTPNDYTMNDNIDALATEAHAVCNDGEDVVILAVDNHHGVYRIRHTDETCTRYAHSPDGAAAVAIFGDFIVLGNVDNIPNRLRWSAPQDFGPVNGAWPSTNFLDVGLDGETIKGLYVVGTSMYVLMKEGTLYTVNGTLGVNEVVRQVNVYGEHTTGIAFQAAACVTRDNVLWHTRGSRNGSYFYGGSDHLTVFQVPVAVAASKRIEHAELDQWVFGSETDQMASPVHAQRLAGLDDVVFASGRRMWAFVNGSWQKHDFPDLTPRQSLWAAASFGHVAIYDPGAAPSLFFLANLSPQTVDTVLFDEYGADDDTGDGSPAKVDAYFQTNEIAFPTARVLRADLVVVNFRRGPINGRDNSFSVQLVCYDTESGEDEPFFTEPSTYTAPPPTSLLSCSVRFEFDAPECRRFAVRISGLDGVIIDEVRVDGNLVGPIRYGPISEP